MSNRLFWTPNCNLHTPNFYCNTTKLSCRHWSYTKWQNTKSEIGFCMSLYYTVIRRKYISHFMTFNGTIFLYIKHKKHVQITSRHELWKCHHFVSIIYNLCLLSTFIKPSWWEHNFAYRNATVTTRTNSALLPARQLDHYWSAVLASA